MAEQKSINEVLSEVMEQWFDERIKSMQGTLMKFGITSGNNILPEDIKVPANVPTAQGIKAELELPDYYEFVDEGVKGIGNLKPDWIAAKATGRFSFRTSFVSRNMVNSIREWGARKARKGVTVKNMDSVAFGTAKKIKRTGIRQTMFFTDNFQEQHIRELERRIETATGLQFELTLTIDPDNRAVRVQG